MTFNRDHAVQTVTAVINRQPQIENGVTVLVFRPGLALDGVAAALSKWAEVHSYQWTDSRENKVHVLDRDFQTIGFTVLTRKGVLPADFAVVPLDVSAASCAGQLFADKVVDLFTGGEGEQISDASIVMTIRHGRKAAPTAAALRAVVHEQLSCGREGMQLRNLHSAPLCKLPVTSCEIDRMTREA